MGDMGRRSCRRLEQRGATRCTTYRGGYDDDDDDDDIHDKFLPWCALNKLAKARKTHKSPGTLVFDISSQKSPGPVTAP